MSDQRKRDDYTKDRFDWLDQVAADPELPASAFKVAFAIATSLWRQKGTVTLMTSETRGSDQVREAWIGSRELADKIAMSRFTVMNMVTRLQERGHLDVTPGTRGRGHSNHYRLVKKGAPANLLKTVKGAHSSLLDGAQADRKSKPKGAPANLLEGEKVRPRTWIPLYPLNLPLRKSAARLKRVRAWHRLSVETLQREWRVPRLPAASPRGLRRLTLLRAPLWLYRQRRSNRPLFEAPRAAELIELIPDGTQLAKVSVLFREAVERPAPEGWVHVAVGLMLQADGASVDGDAYRCAVADSLYRDPECWENEPGVSAAVVVKAIRVARLSGAPTPGAFVQLCLKNRRLFKAIHLRNDISDLMTVRYAAEDEL
jgi:hypothetical protein